MHFDSIYNICTNYMNRKHLTVIYNCLNAPFIYNSLLIISVDPESLYLS